VTKVVKFGPALVLALLVTLLLGGWSTWSYGLRCANCAVGAQLLEQRFWCCHFGATGPKGSLEQILSVFLVGRCKHAFRREGFGRTTHLLLGGNGRLRDHVRGGALRPRIVAVQALSTKLPSPVESRELAAENACSH